ncbi:MAG: ankyrin repeat domain-containing protein [Candidatus Hydrogenedentales bacterium]|jgi:ankyrin repeat protein
MNAVRVLVVFAVLWMPFAASAATIAVPSDSPTIQQAIDRAAPGDIVSVKAGEYNEHLVLKTGVNLAGEGRDKVTVLADCSEGPVLKAQDCKNVDVTGIAFKHSGGQAKADAKEVLSVCSLTNCTLKLVDCAFTDSPAVGIFCQGDGGVVVRGCSVRGNAGNGIVVKEGVTLLAEKTEVIENPNGVGLWVNGVGAKLTLQDCTVSENGKAGVYADDRSTLSVTACNVLQNGGDGVAIVNQNTKASIADCTLANNRGSGLYVDSEDTHKVEARGNTLSENGSIAQGEVQVLMIHEQFDVLEAIAKRLRDEKVRWPNGDWQLDQFYDWLSRQVHFFDAPGEAAHFARIEKWKAAYPDSITWRLVLAGSYRECGWRERGGGYASTVTEAGWKKFHEYLAKAQTALDETRATNPKDPAFYQMSVDQALEYYPGSAINSAASSAATMIFGVAPPSDPVKIAFEEGIAVEPEYFPLYYSRVRSLLPRWGGDTKSMVAFAEDSATSTASIPGAALYARIAWEVLRWEKDEMPKLYAFSWDKIEEGYRQMIQHYPNPGDLQNTLCRVACAYDDKKVAQEMFAVLGENWSKSSWGSNAHFASWKKWALENGPRPGNSLLAKAIAEGNLPAVQSALQNGEDPNTVTERGITVLALAIDEEKLDVARALIEKGADVNLTPKGNKPNLLHAMENESLDSFKLLLESKADPNIKSQEGWPLLTVAITRSMPDKALLLLDSGADPNLPSGVGTPPLSIAIAKHLDSVTAKLVERGADVNARAESGITPLLRAAHDSNLLVVKLLVEKGADINLGTKEGWTPLMEASKMGKLDIVTCLVEKGCDVNLKPKLGKSALALAKAGNKAAVVEYLVQHGAKE